MSVTNESVKESLETKFVASDTSISCDRAFSASMNTHNSLTIINSLKEVSGADIPMTVSIDQQKNVERRMDDISLSSNTEKSEHKITYKETALGIKEKTIQVTNNLKDDDIDLASEKRENELHDNREIAIYDRFERKREAHHDQGRIEIKKHLIQSKQRLEKLEKILKLAGEKKQKVEIKKKVEIPLHLKGGINNNFKVNESLKSCWYDRVAENYLSKRRAPKKEISTTSFLYQEPNQVEQIISRRNISKKEAIVTVQKGLLGNIIDAPVMSSLNTQIEMNDDTLYYFTKIDYDFNTEKLKRKSKLKQIADQIARNKAVTSDSLEHNGINVMAATVPDKVEEENILINIVEDNTMEEDDKLLQRRQSLLRSKKSFTEKDEKLITRRSFLLSRSNSRRGNEPDSSLSDAAGEDGIINIFPPQSPPSQFSNLSFNRKSPGQREDCHSRKLSDFIIGENGESELHDITPIILDAKTVGNTRVKRVSEPLTWNEMIEMDRQKIVAPEKVPLMKWCNPKF